MRRCPTGSTPAARSAASPAATRCACSRRPICPATSGRSGNSCAASPTAAWPTACCCAAAHWPGRSAGAVQVSGTVRGQARRAAASARRRSLARGGCASGGPLCIEVEQRGGALCLRLDFSPTQWQRSTLEGLLQRLQDELRAIRAHCLHAPRLRLSGTAQAAGPVHTCTLLEPARRHPEPVALAHGDLRLAQVVLETRSNRLARHLIECGVGPGMRVGLCLAHGMAMIEGLLAILEAGGAFVPLDPDCPREQMACMVEDSGLQWLLTSTALCSRVPLREEVEAICLDLLDAGGYSSEPPNLALRPQDPACLLHAGGAPGRPGAVTIGHADLSRHMQAIGRSYGMTPADAALPCAAADGALERWAADLAAQMLRGLCRRRVDFSRPS
ncbi:AMP-binding protein [Azotobacter sp. CWF10]